MSNPNSDIVPPSQELTNLQINESIDAELARLDSLTISQVVNLKDVIESELSKNIEILSSQNVDMDSSLVTADGFPRSDVDVLQIRLARRNINMLRNDLNKVILKSHSMLNAHFEQKQEVAQSNKTGDNEIEYKIPFARFTEITPGGPIEKTGVQLNDKLVSIGDIHAGNHNKLKNVQMVVLRNENKELPIRIMRDNSLLDLKLIPTREWEGRGLLGCKLDEC